MVQSLKPVATSRELVTPPGCFLVSVSKVKPWEKGNGMD